jgi:MoaA/NifB/PqqE/SkfB family radical SAM enzyme
LIESLNRAGLQDMQISIDGVKTNNVTIKVLDSLRRRLALLKEHATFNVVVSGVVGACPPAESFEVIAYAKKMGFRPRVLLIHGPDGQIKLTQEELAVYRRIKQVIESHPFDASKYKDKIIEKGSHPFKCRAGSRYLYVDENGLVSWCSQTRQYFSKALAEYTPADLKEQFYTYKSCQDRCTLGCVRTASNFDNWRGQDMSLS